LLQRDSLDFSFAGLKTAVRTHAARLDSSCEQARADLAASTQAAIVDVLAKKAMAALAATGCDRLVVAGGVGANASLRERLRVECARRRGRVHFPELALCTDNGAMIALAAAMRWQRGIAAISTDYAFDVRPRWPLVAA
jgi:N6-L-threonylcarbamoyladenine synthase